MKNMNNGVVEIFYTECGFKAIYVSRRNFYYSLSKIDVKYIADENETYSHPEHWD